MTLVQMRTNVYNPMVIYTSYSASVDPHVTAITFFASRVLVPRRVVIASTITHMLNRHSVATTHTSP